MQIVDFQTAKKGRRLRRGGVYGIRCDQTGRWYVGGSITVYGRVYQHLLDLSSKYWSHIFREDSRENTFTAHILEFVENPTDVAAREQYWIDKLDSLNNGYNRQYPTHHSVWKKDSMTTWVHVNHPCYGIDVCESSEDLSGQGYVKLEDLRTIVATAKTGSEVMG